MLVVNQRGVIWIRNSIEAGFSRINKLCKGKPAVTLRSKADCCKGSKTDFESVSRGSSPLSVV